MAAGKVMVDIGSGEGIGARSLGSEKGVGNKALFLLTPETEGG
jgi:hypothetical protein